MFNLDLITADSANNMMMIGSSNFVNQMPTAGISRPRQTVLREKLESTINSRFSKPGQIPFCLFIDLAWGKMPPCMAKGMQDRHTLGCHSKSRRAKLRGIFRSTRQNHPYCKFLQ